MDETGVSIVPNRRRKVIGRRGARSVQVMASAERGQLCTMICCFSASGAYVPPMFLFPNCAKDVSMDHAPDNSIYARTPKGWTSSEMFAKWLRHFRNYATATPDIPVLLIVDNHSTHISYKAVKYCRRHHIELLTLPPHSTHKLQPLDVSFFSPLKDKYSYYMGKWLAERPGQKAQLSDIPAIFQPAYNDAAKPETAISGFRKTGIWQFHPVLRVWGPNRHIFDDEFSDSESEQNQDGSENDDDIPPRWPRNPTCIDTNQQDGIARDQPLGPASGLPSRPPRDQPLGSHSGLPSGPPRDQPLGSHSGLPSGPPRYQPLGLHSSLPVGPPTESSDSEADFITKPKSVTKRRYLARISESQGYGDLSSDEDLETTFQIISAADEAVHEQGMEVVVPINNPPKSSQVFKVGPNYLEKSFLFPCSSTQATSTRRPRAKQQSELITSDENLAKLSKKESKKKSKSSGSSSEERRDTRSTSQAAKLTLRSGKNI